MILANKCESYKKIVDYPTAMELAIRHKVPLLEVSAKNGTNLEQAYNMLIEMLIENVITQKPIEDSDTTDDEILEVDDGMTKKSGFAAGCCIIC